MELHLRKGTFLRSFYDINLYGGYKPVIGTISPHLPGSSESLQISPAIWFKTFALRAICIDCDGRDLRWTPVSQTLPVLHAFDDDKTVKEKFQRSIFDSGECFDFDISLEDMFDSVISFINKLKQKQIKECDVGFEVLRLLHCYILPIITLHKEDAPGLQEGQTLIDRRLQNLEKEIDKKTRSMTLLETTLYGQRRRLLRNEGFQRELFIRSCKVTFLADLLQHIEDDIRAIDVKLEESQFEVDKLKCDIQPNEKALAERRKQRNMFHEERQSICLVRENIRNVLYRPQVKRVKSKIKIQENKFHEIYSELSDRLQKIKDEINGLFRNKLRVLSVREAMNTTLEELKVVSETTGVQMMSDGTTETDILGCENKPIEWQTLNDKVLILVKENKTILKHHQQFISSIKQIMELSIKEMKLFSQPALQDEEQVASEDIVIEDCGGDELEVRLRRPTKQEDNKENRKTRITKSDKILVEKMGHSSVKTRKTRQHLSHQSNDLGLDRNTRVQSIPIKSAMESIKRKVSAHMREIIGLLLQNIGEEEKITPNRLWIAYELSLHRDMLPDLAQFYEMAYEYVWVNRGQQLSRLTPMNLGITEPWIVEYYDSDLAKFQQSCEVLKEQQNRVEPQVEYPIVVSERTSTSHKSYDFSNCTVEQLYDIANEDLQSVSDALFNPTAMGDNSCDFHSDEVNISSDQPTQNANGSECDFELTTYSSSFENSSTSAETNNSAESIDQINYLSVDENKKLDVWSEFHQTLEQNTAEIIKCHTVLGKLKLMTKSIKYIADSVSSLKQSPGKNSEVSCDDLLTLLIVHLLELDTVHRWKLYAHLKLVLDLMPPFLRGSQHDYALVNYYQAFSYLHDYQLLNQRRSSSSLSVF